MTVAAAGLGLVIGLVMGGLGGGGGVLVVPALVFLLGRTPQVATTASLVIVGVTAVVGAATRLRDGVDRRAALVFGVVGVPAAYLGTRLNRHVPSSVLLLAFAALTLLAAAGMLVDTHRRGGSDRPGADRPGATSAATAPTTTRRRLRSATAVAGCALLTGFLTGFLGVGGGFLVVPALVVVLRMPMTLAVGTSLAVIAVNAGASLGARLGDATFDWPVIIPFTVAAVAAGTATKPLARRASGAALSRAFAVLLIAVGAFVAVRSVRAL